MANGSLGINGIQLGLPTGQENIGPFTIPFSAISSKTILGPTSTTQTVAVPAGCSGVNIVGNNTASGNNSWGVTNAASGLGRFSPQFPVIQPFDLTAVPANIYVSVTGATGQQVTVQFW